MIIRAMKVNDIFKVQECNKKNIPENYHALFLIYTLITSPLCSFIVLNKDQMVIGYVIAKVKDKLEESEEADNHTGYIISLAVDQEYRREGLGQVLLSLAMHGIKLQINTNTKLNSNSNPSDNNKIKVYLNVRISNTNAISLYKNKLNFKQVKIEPDYYQDKESAVLMLKILN
ncbi:N-alpha-acetyltransferase 10/11 [Nematocida sp. AWRm80]|nr:N-alpha-acetyltransferase 10/11 [Nematocida sp. AWRm80]